MSPSPLLDALKSIASVTPQDGQTLNVCVTTEALYWLAADVGKDVDQKFLGTRLVVEHLCIQLGYLRVRVSAPIRKATAAELRAESKRLGLAAESTDAA